MRLEGESLKKHSRVKHWIVVRRVVRVRSTGSTADYAVANRVTLKRRLMADLAVSSSRYAYNKARTTLILVTRKCANICRGLVRAIAFPLTIAWRTFHRVGKCRNVLAR